MGRSVKQCKTKDQNFKVRQFNKSSDPIDLMEFSLKRLR